MRWWCVPVHRKKSRFCVLLVALNLETKLLLKVSLEHLTSSLTLRKRFLALCSRKCRVHLITFTLILAIWLYATWLYGCMLYDYMAVSLSVILKFFCRCSVCNCCCTVYYCILLLYCILFSVLLLFHMTKLTTFSGVWGDPARLFSFAWRKCPVQRCWMEDQWTVCNFSIHAGVWHQIAALIFLIVLAFLVTYIGSPFYCCLCYEQNKNFE